MGSDLCCSACNRKGKQSTLNYTHCVSKNEIAALLTMYHNKKQYKYVNLCYVLI